MFTKLLKQEFKATGRIVPFIYLVTVFLILINLLTRQLDIKWLSGLLMVLLVIFGMAQILMTYVIVVSRYYKNLYNSEGYLMHTLPVESWKLLFSKALIAFIWLMISYLVMAGVVLTMMLIVAGDQKLSLSQVINQVIVGTGLQPETFWRVAMAFAGYLCLSILYLLAQIYFSITVGNLSRFHKLGIGAPILAYMALYFVLELGTFVSMITIPLGVTFEGTSLKFVPQSMLVTLINPDQFVFGLGSIPFSILATCGMFIATARLMRRHTSLK